MPHAMVSAFQGHQFLNSNVSGNARAHFGDTHNETTVVWNTIHIVVQESGGDDRHVGLPDNVRSPAREKKINENVEALLHHIDPEFKEITMLGARFVEERAFRLRSAAPDSFLPPEGTAVERQGSNSQPRTTFTSNSKDNSILSKISELEGSEHQSHSAIGKQVHPPAGHAADVLMSSLVATRRELSELRESLNSVVAQQRDLLMASQTRDKPLVQRLFLAIFNAAKSRLRAQNAGNSTKAILIQVFGPWWGVNSSSTNRSSEDDAAAASLVDDFLRSSFLLACCYIPRMAKQLMSRVRQDPVFAILLPCLGSSLVRLMHNIPQHVSWLQGDDSITLEDALGVSIKIPLLLCRSSKIFHAFIETHFENKPGMLIVQARKYSITLDSRRGRVILQGSEGWKTGEIKARSTVIMSIHVSSNAAICLNCGNPLVNQSEDVNEFYTCPCGRLYRTHHEKPSGHNDATSVPDQTASSSGIDQENPSDAGASAIRLPSPSSIDGNANSSHTTSLDAGELAVIRNIDLMLPVQQSMGIPEDSSESYLLPPDTSLADALTYKMSHKTMSSAGEREEISSMLTERLEQTALGQTYINGGPGSAVNRLPPNSSFEDLVAAQMMDVTRDMQRQVREKLASISKSTGMTPSATPNNSDTPLHEGQDVSSLAVADHAAGSPPGMSSDDSRDLQVEELKAMMQKLSSMQLAMSNVYNTMHENAMNSIRNIKA
ncbi:uncharacterized protein A1O9_03687 [Exophiala aquamarina CBS 119918]|uniref:Ubiquitin-like domain-containing protein n=1 Tax=Exophiala aquamarina CBS 119918 TaxID=1182545 RepID=A0A072PFG4_9EURO|nr:uncharacterized protein A1O9_03687 [Exophiala aquamarina CBS 119918]KEF58844.1 hypothetical protein A1O9_03687 [Exophiala aquamarina CBS 119918]